MQSASNPIHAVSAKTFLGAKKRPFLSPLPSSLSLLILLLLLAGCPAPETTVDKEPAARPLEGVQLRLAVVDDPSLVDAVGRAAGEWNAQTGSELIVEAIAEKDLLDADPMPADVVLCPSRLLGELSEAQRIAPVPPGVLRSSEWGGVFELLKLREAACGERIMAVPFGSPVFCCYYRPDLLEKLGRRPPRTWAEYQELADLLEGRGERGEGRGSQKAEGGGRKADSKDSPLPLEEGSGARAWCGVIEPLAPGWAGLTLLARAAPYAKHHNNYSTLFNIETMEPLVAGPPFVRALEELVAAAKLGPADPFRYDPSAVRESFWRGECGMALSWPTAANEGRVESGEGREVQKGEGGRGKVEEVASDTHHSSRITHHSSPAPRPSPLIGFCELPGSREVFNLDSRDWDVRGDDDDVHVPLITIAGRLGVVSAKSDKSDAAFQLLLWLSDSRMSPQISATSPATTLFRRSNLASPGQWVEPSAPPLAAAQYADATAAALDRQQWLAALPIPGHGEYLAALDEAVASAVRGEQSPLIALLEVDKQWRAITERLGLDQQRAAYRHSLGLE